MRYALALAAIIAIFGSVGLGRADGITPAPPSAGPMPMPTATRIGYLPPDDGFVIGTIEGITVTIGTVTVSVGWAPVEREDEDEDE